MEENRVITADGHFDDRIIWGNLEANIDFLTKTGFFEEPRKGLEVGCGFGTMLWTLREKGWDVEGVELRQDLVEKGEETLGSLPVQIVESTGLPFDSSSFDAVLSFDVLEHIPDTDAHLQEVWRVLKPGGSYWLQTPNGLTNPIFETIRNRSLTSWRAEHCSLHNYWQLRSRLAANGFTCKFVDVPVVTDFFRRKIQHVLGSFGLGVLKVVNPDKFPLSLRTNFFVVAERQG